MILLCFILILLLILALTALSLILHDLKAGNHTVSIRFNPEDKGFDNNMSFNRDNLNDWNIDYMTVSAL